MLKIFLIFFLLQFSLLAPGQEGVGGDFDSDSDMDIQELTEIREANQELVQKINPESSEKLVNPNLHPLIQIQQLGYQEITYEALKDTRVQNILDKALRDGLIANIPANTIHKLIMDKVSGTPAATLLNKYPGFLNKFIEILRHKEALPDLLKILSKKEELKKYFIIWIIILIITIWLRGRLLSTRAKWNFIQRVLLRLSINLLSISSSIMAFYFIFENELASTLKLFKLS
jgi:hypothetical protein